MDGNRTAWRSIPADAHVGQQIAGDVFSSDQLPNPFLADAGAALVAPQKEGCFKRHGEQWRVGSCGHGAVSDRQQHDANGCARGPVIDEIGSACTAAGRLHLGADRGYAVAVAAVQLTWQDDVLVRNRAAVKLVGCGAAAVVLSTVTPVAD